MVGRLKPPNNGNPGQVLGHETRREGHQSRNCTAGRSVKEPGGRGVNQKQQKGGRARNQKRGEGQDDMLDSSEGRREVRTKLWTLHDDLKMA